MQFTKLEELAQNAHTHPNYKYKSKADCMKAAKVSFDRLPEKQKKLVANGWAEYLSANKVPAYPDLSNPDVAAQALNDLMYYRFLAQTNLFFLCKILEKYAQVAVNTHEEICNSFFVQKDPTFLTFEKFATDYSDKKRRMLLTPRGGFKSSIDIADSVQWIITFPAITILILTGVYKLASDFVGELRQHFTLEENGIPDPKSGKSGYGPRKLMDKETGDWSDSMFQVLFREHCVRPDDGTQFEFQTPAVPESDGREPSVRAASIEQALSGMHFGILKLDDVVTNENSQTITRLEAVNKQISINEAMLHPYGFMDVIGTWYDEQDYYGIAIKQEETFAVEEGMLESIKGTVDSGRFESSVFFKVYLRAAWWPTEEAAKAGKIEAEMKKSDWTLWFPERLTYEFLFQKKKTDPYFAIKYLNNPRQMHRVKFPRELLVRRTIPHNQLPQQGIVVTTVDTAYSTKSWADYTVILTALIFGGRFYIINMVRGRFNEYDLPKQIAATAYKWKPKRIAIEDSVGVKWMGRELKREMDKLQVSIPVEFVSLGYGNKSKSKQLKAKPVVRLLGDERMYFLNSCEGLQEIYSELEKFTGTSDDTHDDIVSAISLLAEQFGAYADMDSKVNFVSQQFVANAQDKEWHDRIYGLGRYANLNAINHIDDNPVTAFQQENAANEFGRKYRTDDYFDPLADLTT